VGAIMRSSTNVSLYKIAHRNLLRSELCLSGRGLHKIAYSGPVRAVSRWTIEQRNPRRLWPLVARRGRHPRQSLLPDAGNPDRPWRLVDWPISSRVRRRNQSGSPVSAGRRVKDRCTACHRLDHDQAERLRPRRTMQWPFASCDWSLTPAKPMPVARSPARSPRRQMLRRLRQRLRQAVAEGVSPSSSLLKGRLPQGR
jgi:hypothetical protein